MSGIQTSQDARFYGLSTKFDKFSNEGKTLVLQFTVKHEQNIDCGGGYIKLFDCSLDQKDMHGETPYLIMFGKNIYLNNSYNKCWKLNWNSVYMYYVCIYMYVFFCITLFTS